MSHQMELRLASLLILALAVVSCRTPRVAVSDGDDDGTSLAGYCYNGVLLAEARGDLNSAYDLLTFIGETDSTFAPAYDKLFAYELGFHNDSAAVSVLDRAVAEDPSNFWYGFKLANYYATQDSLKRAVAIYETLLEKHPDRKELLYALLTWYTKMNDATQALSALDRIESIEGVSEQTFITRMQIYSGMGKKELAKEQLAEKIKQSPGEDIYKSYLAHLYVSDGQFADAIAVYDTILAASPYDPQASYDRLVAVKAVDAGRFENDVRRVLSDAGYQTDFKFGVLLNLIVKDKSLSADTAFVKSMFDIADAGAGANDANIPMLRASYCELVKDTVGAINAYREVISRDPANMPAYQNMLNLAISKGDIDGVYFVCKNATVQFPDEVIYSYYLAVSCLFKGLTDEAKAVCLDAVRHIDGDTYAPVATQLYSILGDLSHEDGDYDAAFDAYEQALKYDPDNTAVLNNYAYFLAIRGGDLDKAEAMIDRAVEIEPDDPTMLDTYAWILFLQGDYALAKIYMDKTLSLDKAPSAEVLEHAGDIYMMCGDAGMALEYWKQALQQNGDSETLKAKIKQRKYIVPK